MQRAASDKTRRHLGSGRGPTSAAKNPKTALWRSRRTVAAAPMPVTSMGGRRTSSLSCYVLLAPSSASLTPKVADPMRLQTSRWPRRAVGRRAVEVTASSIAGRASARRPLEE